MAKFVYLYSGGRMPESDAEQVAVMKAWDAWFHRLGDAIVDPGSPFTPSLRHISSSGAVSSESAGAVASGYTILQAESLDAAVQAGLDCPILQAGGQITVHEVLPVM